MAKPYSITINNGSGQANILNGTYNVTSTASGYNGSSIEPSEVTVVDGTNEYEFTISAEGVLTLHVSDNGQTTGNPIVGAKFIRCDETGTTYGSEVQSDQSGNAIFNYVPYGSESNINVYYKQISSDSEHEFDSSVKSVVLESISKTVEVQNSLPESRTIKLYDKNYSSLPITTATITLN